MRDCRRECGKERAQLLVATRRNSKNAFVKSTGRLRLQPLALLAVIALAFAPSAECWAPLVFRRSSDRTRWGSVSLAANDDNDNNTHGDNDHDDLIGDFGDASEAGGGVILEDLAWRVAKLKLEEQNTKRFLKARARFLPYDDCRRWVQAWGLRWQTAEDWRNWIAMGEKRNSYIPSRPDEYYGRLGQWVSWEHFLLTPPSPDDSKQSQKKQSQ